MNLKNVFVALALGQIAIGCPGAKTTVDFTVKVSATACKEDKESPMSTSQTALLDCEVEAGTSVRVAFPRKAWSAIKYSDSEVDAGPGK